MRGYWSARAAGLVLTLVVALAGALRAEAAATTKPATTGPATASASKVDEAISAVETQTRVVEGNGETQDRQQTNTYLEQVKAGVKKKDFFGARDAAQQASRMMQTADYQVVWSQLLAQINKECEAQKASFPEAVKAALEKARTRCLAAKTEEDLEGLEEELQGLMPQASRTTSAERFGDSSRSLTSQLDNALRAVRLWREMLGAQAAGNTPQALQHLSNIEMSQSRLFTSTALAKVRLAIQESANAALERRIAALAEAVAKAGSPEECQKALERFNSEAGSSSRYNMDPSLRTSKTTQTVQTWINVWSEQMAGHPRRALGLISQQQSNMMGVVTAFDYTVIPQKTWANKQAELDKQVAEEGKVILEPELKRMVEAIDKAETLDAMQEVAKRCPLESNRPGVGYTRVSQFDNQTVVGEISTWVADVNQLAWMQEEISNDRFRNVVTMWAGNVPSVGGASVVGIPSGSSAGVLGMRVGTQRWKGRTQAIRQAFFVQALTRYSQIADLKPLANESLDQMLLRVADEAFKGQDYRKVLLALDAYSMVFYGGRTGPEWLASDIRGCSAYVAGLNFEGANVPEAAARSLLQVLRETGSRVPVKAATERLQVLRQKHPEAVTAAATQPSGIPTGGRAAEEPATQP